MRNLADNYSSFRTFYFGMAVVGGLLMTSFLASCCLAYHQRKKYESPTILIGFQQPFFI